MAQRTVTILTSDISGEEISDGETVNFSIDGTAYVIDLTKAEASELRKKFEKYTAAGRKAGGKRGARPGTGSGRSKEQLEEIRTWANANGHTVAARGRIKSDILEAYDKAH